MKEDLVCVVPLSQNNVEGIILTHISSHVKKKYPILPFKPHSVPYDFDGDRLLWMEWDEKLRVFKYFDFTTTEVKEIAKFTKNYGQIGFCRLMITEMRIVRDFRKIEIIDIQTGSLRQMVGCHASDIVAITWIKAKDSNSSRESQYDFDNSYSEKVLIISIDYGCNICIWDKQGLVMSHNISQFPELTLEYRQPIYFTMGYPYVISINDKKIAFSTDLGVLVVSLPYFSKLSIIS